MLKVGDEVGYLHNGIKKGVIVYEHTNNYYIIGKGYTVKFYEKWHPALTDENTYNFSGTDLIRLNESKRIFNEIDPYGEEDWEE